VRLLELVGLFTVHRKGFAPMSVAGSLERRIKRRAATRTRGTVTILEGRKKRRSKATVIAGPGQ
jgi:hypothetical protein